MCTVLMGVVPEVKSSGQLHLLHSPFPCADFSQVPEGYVLKSQTVIIELYVLPPSLSFVHDTDFWASHMVDKIKH